jgi:hypothetical protein
MKKSKQTRSSASSAAPCAAFVVQYMAPDKKWRDFTNHHDLLAAKNCVSNKRDKSAFRIIKRTDELIEPNTQTMAGEALPSVTGSGSGELTENLPIK